MSKGRPPTPQQTPSTATPWAAITNSDLLPRMSHISVSLGTADARQRELLSQCACIPWPEIAAEAKAPVISAGPLRHNCIPRTDKNLSFTTHQ